MSLGARANARDDGAPAVRIDADVPAGNVVVSKISDDLVELAPDLRDTEGYWFYWNFRVRNAAGRTLRFEFPNNRSFSSRGPAISIDKGKTWRWQSEPMAASSHFDHTFDAAVDETRLAVTIPYLPAHLEEFLTGHEGNPGLRQEELCLSRKGRPVPLLRLGRQDDDFDYCMIVTGRHHACETMASFVVEGMMGSILADDETGHWFRDRVRVIVIPMVDYDGVVDGDQGKNRAPHDHGRDYHDEGSIYPETATIRKLRQEWTGDRPWIFLDMHCPYIRGGRYHENIYQVGQPKERSWARQQAFARLVAAERRGTLPYEHTNDLPSGVSWNTPQNYANGRSSSQFMAMQSGNTLSTSWEIPYANAGGAEVHIEPCRDFGIGMGRAVRRYFSEVVATGEVP